MARNLFDTFMQIDDQDGSSDSDYDESLYVTDEESPTDSEDSDSEMNSPGAAASTTSIYTGKDGSQWSSQPPVQARVPARNLIYVPIKKGINADHVQNEVDMFKAYITSSMVESIVKSRNL